MGEPSSSVTLNGIKEVLQNTFVNLRKLNITDLTDILVTDGKNKINSTVHHNSFRNRRHFTSDECQSYVFSDKDENDEFLRRLFLRKIGGLTHNRLKGTSLYSNFMINSLQINLHKIRKLEDLTDSNQKNAKEVQFGLAYEARVNFYLHLNLPPNKGKIRSNFPSAFSCVVESKETTIVRESFSNVFVNLEDARKEIETRVGGKESEKIFERLCNAVFWRVVIRKGGQSGDMPTPVMIYEKIDTGCGNLSTGLDRAFVDLETFMIGYVWAAFVYYVRKEYENHGNYLNGAYFVNSVRELWKYLSFKSTSLNLLEQNYKEVCERDLKTINGDSGDEEWLDFISTIFWSGQDLDTFSKKFNTSRINQTLSIDIEGGHYYSNVRLWYGNLPLRSRDKNIGDNDIGWDIAWGMLLGGILCINSQKFLTYNREIELYSLNSRKEVKEIKEITERAISDFRDFYDVDVISGGGIFRSAFEIAKKQFSIDFYYEVLKRKLDLFSNYEIAGDQQKRNEIIEFGGLTAVLLLTVTLGFVIYQATHNSEIAWVISSLIGITISVMFSLVTLGVIQWMKLRLRGRL